MIMANDSPPVKKKRYEKPSITDPETGRSGPRTNYGPVGLTGCGFGDIGSACVDGNIPSGPPKACNSGGQPKRLNCSAGTSADDACLNGTEANRYCSTGTGVASDCTSGIGPQGATCADGNGVI